VTFARSRINESLVILGLGRRYDEPPVDAQGLLAKLEPVPYIAGRIGDQLGGSDVDQSVCEPRGKGAATILAAARSQHFIATRRDEIKSRGRRGTRSSSAAGLAPIEARIFARARISGGCPLGLIAKPSPQLTGWADVRRCGLEQSDASAIAQFARGSSIGGFHPAQKPRPGHAARQRKVIFLHDFWRFPTPAGPVLDRPLKPNEVEGAARERRG